MRKRKSSAPAQRSTGMPIFAVWLALIALNTAIYSSVGSFELVNWDDPSYISENAMVLRGLNWSTAWWAITTGYSPYWHPLTWLSHLLDITLFGMDAGKYHLVNLALHTGNSVLLFELLRRTTGAAGRSAFVAAMFAAHPLHVESVAWVTERKDVLSTFFLFLTMLAYVGYVRQRSRTRYVGVLALFGLALMSKPMVVTLPVVLLLFDIWPLRRTDVRALVIEKLPLFALAFATGVATIVIQHRVGAMAGLDALPWTTRFGNASIGYVAYLWKTVWPSPLAAFYPLFELSALRVAAAVTLMAGLTLVAFRMRATRPYVWVGWLWYVVTIAPVIGFLQAGEQGMADRFMYVPMIGLLIAVAWSVAHAGWAVRSAAVALVIVSALASHAQTAHWENSLTLWSHAIRVAPRNYIAHENFGQALRERGRLEEAMESYERALAHAPGRSPGYIAVVQNSIGLVLTRQGKIAEARDRFRAAVASNPRFAEARTNLGNSLTADGQSGEAIEHYREAIRIRPEYVEPRIGLGAALLRSGRAVEAIAAYREALALDPNLAEAHNGLGGALLTAGRDEEAMAEFKEAIRLKSDLPTAHYNIALLLIKKGDAALARRHLETALTIDPGYQPARQALQVIAARSY